MSDSHHFPDGQRRPTEYQREHSDDGEAAWIGCLVICLAGALTLIAAYALIHGIVD